LKEPKLRKTKKKIVTFFEGKEADQTFSPIEISRELKLERTTVQRIVLGLEDKNYLISKVEEGKKRPKYCRSKYIDCFGKMRKDMNPLDKKTSPIILEEKHRIKDFRCKGHELFIKTEIVRQLLPGLEDALPTKEEIEDLFGHGHIEDRFRNSLKKIAEYLKAQIESSIIQTLYGDGKEE